MIDTAVSKVPDLHSALRFPLERRARDAAMAARRRGKPKSPERVRRLPVRRDAEAPVECDDDIAEPIGPGEGGKP